MAIFPAVADELVMPYSCTMDRGSPRLAAADATTYQIIGSREDAPFSACGSARGGACEMMMVHKFTIECGGQKVAWAKVAGAGAAAAGIALPAHLPPGFAPISRFQGRLVLPGFSRTTRLPKVETQPLSADSAVERNTHGAHAEDTPWVTVIDPAIRATAPTGAFRVAGVVSMLLISLMAACLFAAWRRMPQTFNLAGASFEPGAASPESYWRAGRSFYAGMASVFQRGTQGWFNAASDESAAADPISRSLDIVGARIAETELLVATLPNDLLLRDVLQTELDGLRGRAADVSRRSEQIGAKRVENMLRGMLRDLDRISRIVHGTVRKEEAETSGPAEVPSTIFEAYRVLGLNAEAPPAAVKKVVDALRMSWHPDHARSEADRRHREDRIKQINAAWDLLKASQAAAA